MKNPNLIYAIIGLVIAVSMPFIIHNGIQIIITSGISIAISLYFFKKSNNDVDVSQEHMK